MTKRPKIAVVGSNMIDLITNIERMPNIGETLEAPSFDLGFGGKGANQAVAAAKLGAEVVMVTKVGDDMFGRGVKENFASFGIDTTYVETVPGVSNGVAPIFVDEEGNNRILIVKGANEHLKPEDVDKAKAKLLGSDFILLQLEVPLETVYRAIEFGVENDIPVILNPAPARPLDFDYVQKVAVFVPNEVELEMITGLPTSTIEEVEEAGKSLLEKGVKTVLVTLGARGALLIEEGLTRLFPAVKVETKDTTGAGDAFIGSFAYYYALTGDIFQAVERANHYAALSTLKTGTQKAFLTRAEFDKARAELSG